MENKRYKEDLEYIRKNDITAYQIAKVMGATESGLNRIIKGEVANPHRDTKLKIHSFVKQDKLKAKNIGRVVISNEEDIRGYFSPSNSSKEFQESIDLINELEKSSIISTQQASKLKGAFLQLMNDLFFYKGQVEELV